MLHLAFLLVLLSLCAGAPTPKSVFSPCEQAVAVKCLDKCRVHCNNGVGNGPDCRPGRARYSNDDVGGVPGAPGARGGGADGTAYVVSAKDNQQVVNSNLVFLGSTTEVFHKTKCQDDCEDEGIQTCRYTCCEKDAAKKCDQTCKTKCNNGVGNGPDCRPGRARFNNDDVGGVPGAPGARGGGALGTEYVTSNKGDNSVVNPNLVFQGTSPDSFSKTKCNDDCEDAARQQCRIQDNVQTVADSCKTQCKAKCNNGVGNGPDCRPGRARFNNDDVGGVPGAPGARGGGELGTEYVTSNKGDNSVVNPDLVFQGTLPGTFHKTRCQDTCEDTSIKRFSCPGTADVEVPTTAPLPPPATVASSTAAPTTSSTAAPTTSSAAAPTTSSTAFPTTSSSVAPTSSTAASTSSSVAATSSTAAATSSSVSSSAASSVAQSESAQGESALLLDRAAQASSAAAGVSAGLIAGIVVGAAACAGVAALVIGLVANKSAAVAPAATHGMPMGHAGQNPLYQSLLAQGENAIYA